MELLRSDGDEAEALEHARVGSELLEEEDARREQRAPLLVDDGEHRRSLLLHREHLVQGGLA